MPDEQRDQQTEPATPRWREEQRKKGRVARSREINSAAVMLFGAILLYLTAGPVYRGMCSMMGDAFGDALVQSGSEGSMLPHFAEVIRKTAWLFAPVFGGIALVAIAAAYGQVGLMISGEALSPNLERLNPIAGLKRLFSMRSLFNVGTSVAKVVVVGTIIWLYLNRKLDELPVLMSMSMFDLLAYICKAMFMVTLLTALVLVVIAAIDYAHQRYQHERDLRMTPQQVKEELKRSEGDPLVKARIRQIQRDTARKRMMEAVPGADVVVKNPTHFAVALKYSGSQMKAPKVVAKGMNLIALRIIELAEEHNVPVVENKPLARTLWKTVDIGDEIPMTLYRAVAEVLAYVYQLRRRRAPA